MWLEKFADCLLVTPRNAIQWNKRNKTFILTRSTNNFITSHFPLSSLFWGGCMPCLDLGMLALCSINFDCRGSQISQLWLISGAGYFQSHRDTAATCSSWIYSSWMWKENECMFRSHSSCLKSKERIKKSPWYFIDSALPWAGAGEGPHSIVFSVWFILALNIPVVGVPSWSLRASSNPDFLHRWLVLQTLEMSSGEHWAHELDTCTDVQLHFPCVHPCTFQALEAVPISFGAFF